MSRLHARKGYGQFPMTGRTRGVEWPAPTHRQRRSSGVGTPQGESMSNHLRTGVVLQFAARKRAHGSGLGLDGLGKTKNLGGQASARNGGLDPIRDGARENLGPLANSLRRDADGVGRELGGAPKELDCGGLVHGSLKHASSTNARMLQREQSILSSMEEAELNSFADRLKAAMGERFSRDDVAKACGISVQAIAQVLKGTTKALTAENTARAARLLGVDWYWLATGEGSATANQAQEQEKSVLSALREIKRLDPETGDQLLARIDEIAEGLRATDNLLRTGQPTHPTRESLVNPDKPASTRAVR